MKNAILAVCILAVLGIVGYKFIAKKDAPKTTPVVEPSISAAPNAGLTKSTLYLFHDESDQDAGCKRIYSYADRAEMELASRLEVKRPDVEKEKSIVEKYQVKVLPTILIVSPDGAVAERYEGEGKETVQKLDAMMARYKDSAK